MMKTEVKISGMICGMCEAHINDAIRVALPVKKVTSSHTKGKTVILSDTPLDLKKLREVIDATGYTFDSAFEETVANKGLFSHPKR